MGCTCRRTPQSWATWGNTQPTVVGRLIHSHFNLGKRILTHFLYKRIKCISGPYVGLWKLHSAQLCMKLENCRVSMG